MPTYKVLVTTVVSAEYDNVMAESEDLARQYCIARERENMAAIEPVSSISMEAEIISPLIRGYRSDEICQYHDMPKVLRGFCPRCLGEHGGTE